VASRDARSCRFFQASAGLGRVDLSMAEKNRRSRLLNRAQPAEGGDADRHPFVGLGRSVAQRRVAGGPVGLDLHPHVLQAVQKLANRRGFAATLAENPQALPGLRRPQTPGRYARQRIAGNIPGVSDGFGSITA
jgi:hypothetical protein